MPPSKKKEELQNLKSESMLAELSISYKVAPNTLPKVTKAEEIYEFLKEIWNKELINVQEQCVALFLNNSNRVIGYKLIGTGTMKMCVIDVKLVVSLALHSMCEAVVLAHNHPTGNLKPSTQDEAITNKIKQALQLIEVRFIDHIIISEAGYLSFAMQGLL
jgi:DNA repair protein RadC